MNNKIVQTNDVMYMLISSVNYFLDRNDELK